MNKVFKIPILILIIVLVFTSCKKDKLKTPEDYRVTYGNQTFGAYINGQPWVPDYSDPGNGVGPISVSMIESGNGYHFIHLKALKSNENFSLYIAPPLAVGRVLLNSTTFPYPSILRPPSYGMYQIYSPSKSFMTDNVINGYVDISRVDINGSSVEGKFEFEAINTITQEKVKFTNGYFRLR